MAIEKELDNFLIRKKEIMMKLIYVVCSFGFALMSMAGSEASAQTVTIGDQCSLPGPHADDRCTVLYHVTGNPANNVVCLWDGNALAACEGKTRWGGGYEYIVPTGNTLEFRRHASFPGNHPAWPDGAAVRNSGTLLKSQVVTTRYRAAPDLACDATIKGTATAASIQNVLNTGVATVCFASAAKVTLSTPLLMKAGQTLKGPSAQFKTKLVPAAGIRAIEINGVSGVTLQNLSIEPLPTARAGYGVLVFGGSNVLLQDVDISYSIIPVGIQANSSNVEVRQSYIRYAGDGLAGPGGASPSIYVIDSNDVRIVKSTLLGNGVGPEGDGELACYNTPNLVVTTSTIQGSGASGMYLVNCDRAVVIANVISGAREWGLDLVNTGQPSGTDYGLFAWNTVQNSRNAAGVVKDSVQNTFQSNNYLYNRQGPNASGSCNGINLRGNTSGYYYINDTSTPWPVYCND